jgi:hypothetical protein
MPILLLCWLLFVFPIMIAGFGVLSAWLYFCGTRQQSPGISPPKFTFGRRKQDNGRAVEASDRLPEV